MAYVSGIGYVPDPKVSYNPIVKRINPTVMPKAYTAPKVTGTYKPVTVSGGSSGSTPRPGGSSIGGGYKSPSKVNVWQQILDSFKKIGLTSSYPSASFIGQSYKKSVSPSSYINLAPSFKKAWDPSIYSGMGRAIQSNLSSIPTAFKEANWIPWGGTRTPKETITPAMLGEQAGYKGGIYYPSAYNINADVSAGLGIEGGYEPGKGGNFNVSTIDTGGSNLDVTGESDLGLGEDLGDPYAGLYEYGYTPVELPEIPDFSFNLSDEEIARLADEAKLAAETEFAPGINEAEQNITKSYAASDTERGLVKPAYEGAMRNTASVIANSVADWAQSLNAIGRYRGGQFGGGEAEIMAAGNADRANLEIALNKRLDDVSTRATNYERDTRDYIAGLRKEQGLKESLLKYQYVREELQNQIAARQQTFTNEMELANFTSNMNQILWAQQLEERKFALTYEAQQIENQILLNSLRQKAGTGGAATIEAPSLSDIMAELYSGTPWVLVQRKLLDMGLDPGKYAARIGSSGMATDINGNPINATYDPYSGLNM